MCNEVYVQTADEELSHTSIYAIANALLKIDGSGRLSHPISGYFSNDFVKVCMWEAAGWEVLGFMFKQVRY